jgi:AcrR family transcriptional regulator
VTDTARAELRNHRRAARRAASRTEILDAAEQVFADLGLRDGSLRDIADFSGYSTAAIYLFFDSKQHLVAETVSRRADEYLAELRRTAAEEGTPLDVLHRIVDVAADFFTERPNFRRVLRQMQGGSAIVGPVLDAFADDVYGRYADAMAIMTTLILDGQAAGEIRDGAPSGLAHFAAVLTNEYVLTEPPTNRNGILTNAQFHDIFDGALRAKAAQRVTIRKRR